MDNKHRRVYYIGSFLNVLDRLGQCLIYIGEYSCTCILGIIAKYWHEGSISCSGGQYFVGWVQYLMDIETN